MSLRLASPAGAEQAGAEQAGAEQAGAEQAGAEQAPFGITAKRSKGYVYYDAFHYNSQLLVKMVN